MRPIAVPAAILAVSLCLARPAAAQQPDVLTQARTLYQGASYTEALILLGALDSPEALEYQALCFLALGRNDDAARVIRDIVSRAPSFVPNPNDVPPRFAELFVTIRTAALPGMVKGAITDGRAHLQAKEYDAAVSLFQRAVALTSDAGMQQDEDVAELKFLAQGFLEVAQASAAGPAPTTTARAAPSVPPRALAAPATAPPDVLPASALRQDMPAWTSAMRTPERSAKGVVVVHVGVDGRVTSASIATSLEPQYDALVLAATARWRYSPATLNGQPIASVKVVAYSVAAP